MPFKTTTPPRPTLVVRKKRPTTAVVGNTPAPAPLQAQKATVKPTPVQPKTLVQPPPQLKAISPPAVKPSPSAQPSPTLPPVEQPPVRDLNQPNRKERDAQARQEILTLLRQRWPLAFPEDLRQLKPWALGIHHALVAELPDTKPALIGKTLNFLQRGGKGAYWHALLKGGPRYNLDGTPNGEVTEKDQEHAREQLAAIRAWRKVKQQARPEPSSSPGADAKDVPLSPEDRNSAG